MSVVDELKRLRRQNPFVPFVIVLNDGRQFQVDRRLQYAFSDEQVIFIDNVTGVQDFKPSDITDLKQLHTVN